MAQAAAPAVEAVKASEPLVEDQVAVLDEAEAAISAPEILPVEAEPAVFHLRLRLFVRLQPYPRFPVLYVHRFVPASQRSRLRVLRQRRSAA